jgi:hypothetical protein
MGRPAFQPKGDPIMTTPIMTKKHCQFIAEVLANTHDVHRIPTTRAFINALRLDNPLFDEEKFRAACRGEE